jgi:hypothetical protein
MIPSLPPPCRLSQPSNVQPNSPTEFGSTTSNPNHQLSSTTTSAIPALLQPEPQVFRMVPNLFGLVHEYSCKVGLLSPIKARLCAVDMSLRTTVDCRYTERLKRIIFPFQSLSVFKFAHWFYTGSSNDAQAAADWLLQNVICAPTFDAQQLHGVDIQTINNTLDSIDNPPTAGSQMLSDAWRISTIMIKIPTGQRLGPTRPSIGLESDDPDGIPFSIPELHYRSLLDVIRSRFSSPLRSRSFTYIPYKVFQTKPGADDEQVRSDLFTADAWIEEHKKIQTLKIKEDGLDVACQYKRAVAALMVYSDPTQVTQFGQTSVSPVYLYFGNQPKQERRAPSSFAAEHIAYFPKVSIAQLILLR